MAQRGGSPKEDELKTAMWYTVSKILEESEVELGFAASEGFCATLTELVFNQAKSLGSTLEQYALHAGRKTVGVEDLRLVTHRTPGLFDDIVANAKHQGIDLTSKVDDKSKKDRPRPKPRKRDPQAVTKEKEKGPDSESEEAVDVLANKTKKKKKQRDATPEIMDADMDVLTDAEELRAHPLETVDQDDSASLNGFLVADSEVEEEETLAKKKEKRQKRKRKRKEDEERSESDAPGRKPRYRSEEERDGVSDEEQRRGKKRKKKKEEGGRSLLWLK
ncbi:hypothetical protein BT69DRAFT_487046 [Atractiella rhizophila]|nr:hypothetical protein BT69DRAFT_487046 [Atractiella rhizophila]